MSQKGYIMHLQEFHGVPEDELLKHDFKILRKLHERLTQAGPTRKKFREHNHHPDAP